MTSPELTKAEILEAARASWKATPHPLLPWFSDEEIVAILDTQDGAQRIEELYREREERIWLARDEDSVNAQGVRQDPFRYGFELDPWKDADRLLAEYAYLYVSGGNRASKSEWAAKRLVECALTYKNSKIWCFQSTLENSRNTQQAMIWKYLPAELKALNFKQDRKRIYRVRYSKATGFTEELLIFPNGTQVIFKTYEQDPMQNQGIGLGAEREQVIARRDAGLPYVPNIGAWADEDMPLPWLETLKTRVTTTGAKMIWTFTAIEGITPTIKEFLGTPKTVESKWAELLPARQNLTGLPLGHMPYIQKPSTKGGAVIYFFTQWNPFSGYGEEGGIKEMCAGKSPEYVERKAYGYARDVMHKAFPLFGEWNIVKREHLPKRGTNYMLTDPGDGSRNWATIWVRVTEGGAHYIYRDWPDAQSYDAWAEPSEDPAQPDGKRGDAQKSLGFGIEQLKNEWLKLETVQGAGPPESDPHRLEIQRKSQNGTAKEEIFDRYVDPRAGNVKHIELHGGTNIIEKFMDLEEPLYFTPASGQEKSIGFAHVNTLLWWNREKPLCALLNAPKLYVSEDCLQVIWMFSNYTDRGGERGGCKDFADLVRYMALADLQYFENTEFHSSAPGKGY